MFLNQSSNFVQFSSNYSKFETTFFDVIISSAISTSVVLELKTMNLFYFILFSYFYFYFLGVYMMSHINVTNSHIIT